MRYRLVLCVVAHTLAFGTTHAGFVVSTQFTGGPTQVGPAVAGVGNSDVWNSFSTSPSASGLTLLDVTGANTGITLDYTSALLFTSSAATPGFGPDYTALAKGYLTTFGTDTVTLNHLSAGEAFSLYVYSQQDNGGTTTTFSVNGSAAQTTTTGLPGGFSLNNNYLVFSGTADRTGSVTITYTRAGSEGDFNGFQLVTGVVTATPEPSSLAVGSFGALVLGAVRKWQKRRNRVSE